MTTKRSEFGSNPMADKTQLKKTSWPAKFIEFSYIELGTYTHNDTSALPSLV